MSMWTAIVVIVVAAMAAEAWRHHLKARNEAPRTDAMNELIDKLDTLDRDLRERIETLERIVTDDKADLKRQFDHLDKAG